MPETLGEWALAYASKGYAVFPLTPRGKIPLAGSRGFYDATTDERMIRQWWTAHPDANIGIATGSFSDPKRKLVVIDVDANKAKNKVGDETLHKWEAEHGELPETCTAISGSGGVHYYYFAPDKYKSIDNVINNIDLKAEGGYIVAPPSIHPCGKPYQWAEGKSILDKGPRFLSGSARELAALVKAEPEPEQSPDKPRFEMPETILSGSRVQSMISLIGKLRGAGLSDDAIREAVEIENAEKCNPPLSSKELEKEVYPALKRDWKINKPYYSADERILISFPKPESLEAVAANPPQLSPVLIDGVLRQGHKMLISGPSKAGKSFALMRLAVGIAEGMAWFGAKCTQGRVLYLNMEIDHASCIDRFLKIYKALGLTFNIHQSNIDIWPLRGFSRPLSEMTDLIIEEAGSGKYAAIVIDPLYKLMDGDENSNSDISRMVGNFDRIARETGAAVIYAHHFAKGTGGDKAVIDRAAGAGTFARDPDAILTMTQLDTENPAHPEQTAWRIEYVLREFPNKKPVSVWWKYPLHEINDALDDVDVETSASRNEKSRKKAQKEKNKQQVAETIRIAESIADPEGKFTLTKFIEAYREIDTIPRTTARRWLEMAGYESIGAERKGWPAYWKKAV